MTDPRLNRIREFIGTPEPQVPEPTDQEAQAALLAFIRWDPDSDAPNPLDGFAVSREVPDADDIDAALAHLLALLRS